MRFGNSRDEIGDTVPQSSPGNSKWSELTLRAGTAFVLMGPALAALYFGPPYSDVLVLIACGLAAWEWARLCGRGTLGLPGGLTIAAVLAAIVAGSVREYSIGGWLIAVGAMAVTLLATRLRRAEAVWFGLGVIYLAAAGLAFVWLRHDPEFGRAMVLWLVVVVSVTDTGAYFAGRGLGGPKLAPSISPGKTWAGLFGGMIAAAAAGLVAALLIGHEILTLIVASLALAIISQVGDLFESSLKRRFGAKDSGSLIPGHGGVLDRIDGLLAGALLVGGVIWLVKT